MKKKNLKIKLLLIAIIMLVSSSAFSQIQYEDGYVKIDTASWYKFRDMAIEVKEESIMKDSLLVVKDEQITNLLSATREKDSTIQKLEKLYSEALRTPLINSSETPTITVKNSEFGGVHIGLNTMYLINKGKFFDNLRYGIFINTYIKYKSFMIMPEIYQTIGSTDNNYTGISIRVSGNILY